MKTLVHRVEELERRLDSLRVDPLTLDIAPAEGTTMDFATRGITPLHHNEDGTCVYCAKPEGEQGRDEGCDGSLSPHIDTADLRLRPGDVLAVVCRAPVNGETGRRIEEALKPAVSRAGATVVVFGGDIEFRVIRSGD